MRRGIFKSGAGWFWLAVLVVWCAFMFPMLSHAQAVSSSAAFEKFMEQATGAGKQTVGFSKDGTPLAAPGVPSAVPDGGSGIKTTGTGQVTNPSGNKVGVTGVGRVSNANIAGALGRFLGRALPIISWPLAIKQLVDELGYQVTDASPDVWKKKNQYVCTVAPCYEWRSQDWGDTGWIPNKQNACVATAALATAASAQYEYRNPRVVGPTTTNDPKCYFDLHLKSNGSLALANQTGTMQFRSSAPFPPGTEYEAAEQQAFLDEIAAKSGWPTSSAVAQAAVAAAESNQEKLPVQSVTVTGPATSPGTTKTETSTNPDASTRTATTTTTHHHTYAGDVITTTTNTTINITNNGTQGTDTTTTEISQPEPAEKPRDPCGLPGTPACKIDEEGTPTAPTLDGQKSVDDALQPLKEFAQNPVSKLPTFPTLNFAFVLPSGCTAVSIPAFAPYLQDIDLCPFVGMFHDIMSMVWVIGGLFGAISMFWRSTMSAN